MNAEERWGTNPTPVDVTDARVFTCLECGALVVGGYPAQLHDAWHDGFEEVLEERIEVETIDPDDPDAPVEP